MPDTLEGLDAERKEAEKKVRYWENREKILKHQQTQLTRKERTNRLCIRAGMLESFLKKPEQLTNEQVMELLKVAFRQPDVMGFLSEMLKGETEM
ncbi:MAG: DUF3847 domain-containing protein [Eubacteriales bacterium]|nr:DUF3847 domain-containing protein [Eubacteriales bacterium]